MESQESDICQPEDMAEILGDPNVENVINLMNWAPIEVPDPLLITPTGELPARNEFPGEHLFDAKVDMTGNHKKHYVLSSKLNKVFVDLGKVVPIQIKWDGTPNLYVRALMVFSLADQWKLPVKRCVTHREKDDPTNEKYSHNEHVLAIENEGAEYLVDATSKRHSVRLPIYLPPGSEYQTISLKFMCKTSCTGGLNRAPTDVIFTLEDINGHVLGRALIGAKICSCPKRDKEKDEQNFTDGTSTGKKKVKVKREEKSTHEEPPAKRVKQEFSQIESAPGCSFMVNAINPEVARVLKAHLHEWNRVKMWELTPPGNLPASIIEIVDDIAVLSQPYN